MSTNNGEDDAEDVEADWDFEADLGPQDHQALFENAKERVGEALEYANEHTPDDSEAQQKLTQIETVMHGYARQMEQQMQELEEQRDEVAEVGATNLVVAADALEQAVDNHQDYHEAVMQKADEVLANAPEVYDADLWDEVIPEELEAAIAEEAKEFMGEDYSPEVPGTDWDYGEDESQGFLGYLRDRFC